MEGFTLYLAIVGSTMFGYIIGRYDQRQESLQKQQLEKENELINKHLK